MKAIKMYWNNTTFLYKITDFLLLPVMVILTSWSGLPRQNEVSLVSFALLIIYILLEVLTDGMNFGGIYNKKFRGIELLKASSKGMKLYRQMMMVDSIRRCLFFGVLAEVCMHSVPLGVIMGAVATLTIIGSRFFAGYVSNLLFSYLAPVLATILGFVFYEGNLIIQWGVALLLAIAVTILAAKLGVVKMERSYYDRED